MGRNKKKSKRILAQGIWVSNDTRATGLNNNDLIIGPSGAGKTGGYVIPNLQNLNTSLIVSDTKNTLGKKYSKLLKDKGFQVQTLDFVNPLRSCTYNPLNYIRRKEDGGYYEQDVLTIAHALVPAMDRQEPFWEKAATSYLVFLIAYVLEALPEDEQNLCSVMEIHRAFCMPDGKVAFDEWVYRNPEGFAARRYKKIKGSISGDKMWGSIIEFASQALEPIDFSEAKAIFGRPSTLDVRELGNRKSVLFLNVSDTDRTFDQIINVFYSQALHVLCEQADSRRDSRLKVPVRLILDDFAANARIPDFDKLISIIRSREISVSIILQSLTQLETMYQHAAAMTIINNCDHLLYLGGQDMETAEFIGSRAFKTPETIMNMPRNKAYLLTSGEKAQLVDKIKPYSDCYGLESTEEIRIKEREVEMGP